MAIGYIIGGGGSGVTSSEVTATKENVLAGKTTVTSDSDDAVVNGTMPNIGKVTQTLGVNDSYTIPKGYHDGTGKVTQNLVMKAAQTYYATTLDQTISSGQYLTGAQTIKKLTQTNLSGGNIKPGVVVKVNNGNTDVFSVTGSMASKGAATYYPTTSDQTIAANQYLTGAQTIKRITQSGLSAANIKNGTTVKVNNGNTDVWAVTGTFYGDQHTMFAIAVRGFGASSSDWITESEASFTMPRKGVVCYGGIPVCYNASGTVICEIYVNGTLKQGLNIDANNRYYWRGGMVDKYFTANAGDVIRIVARATAGEHAMSFIHAVCCY